MGVSVHAKSLKNNFGAMHVSLKSLLIRSPADSLCPSAPTDGLQLHAPRVTKAAADHLLPATVLADLVAPYHRGRENVTGFLTAFGSNLGHRIEGFILFLPGERYVDLQSVGMWLNSSDKVVD